ncbi:MAG TPA: PLDc N-terminal domain-containing protein [Planctomycetota bacterium]|nr:PLDc N-terminal domain-containing protein [Planctomycetota bacterium]
MSGPFAAALVWALVAGAVVYSAVSTAAAVWTAHDARARGVDPRWAWVLIVFLLNAAGLALYLLVRPPGVLSPCAACGARRLGALERCPVCRS